MALCRLKEKAIEEYQKLKKGVENEQE